jgi:hypothetical protein
VGIKHGVCRDFAVLGYCEKGLDCEKQHVKECPDFVDTGICSTKGCKLPHVIRAKHNRAGTTTRVTSKDASDPATSLQAAPSVQAVEVVDVPAKDLSAQQATIDLPKASSEEEFIPLTFLESSEDEEDEDEEEEEDEDDEGMHEDENMHSEEEPPGR